MCPHTGTERNKAFKGSYQCMQPILTVIDRCCALFRIAGTLMQMAASFLIIRIFSSKPKQRAHFNPSVIRSWFNMAILEVG